jgi:hypothetical protein
MCICVYIYNHIGLSVYIWTLAFCPVGNQRVRVKSLSFSGLHGVISRKIELFITTAVTASDTTRRYIPEDRTLHNHRCDSLRYYTALYPGR